MFWFFFFLLFKQPCKTSFRTVFETSTKVGHDLSRWINLKGQNVNLFIYFLTVFSVFALSYSLNSFIFVLTCCCLPCSPYLTIPCFSSLILCFLPSTLKLPTFFLNWEHFVKEGNEYPLHLWSQSRWLKGGAAEYYHATLLQLIVAVLWIPKHSSYSWSTLSLKICYWLHNLF